MFRWRFVYKAYVIKFYGEWSEMATLGQKQNIFNGEQTFVPSRTPTIKFWFRPCYMEKNDSQLCPNGLLPQTNT